MCGSAGSTPLEDNHFPFALSLSKGLHFRQNQIA
jgi:hypothetical protein